MKLRQALVGVCFLAIFVAACAAPSEDAASSADDKSDSVEKAMTSDKTKPGQANHESEAVAKRLELRKQLTDHEAKKLQAIERVQDEDVERIRGEVPDEILERVIADLMTKTSAARKDIKLIHAESLIWNDGSLGCGKPGQMYTQALVPGYRVILGHHGQQFDYRATEKGYFVLCDQPTLAAPGAGRNPPVQ